MLEEDRAISKFTDKKETKTKRHISRKFIAFLLCLVALVLMSVLGKGEQGFPYIIGLFAAYTTGNVVQKFKKE